jgi:hypothetical protein
MWTIYRCGRFHCGLEELAPTPLRCLARGLGTPSAPKRCCDGNGDQRLRYHELAFLTPIGVLLQAVAVSTVVLDEPRKPRGQVIKYGQDFLLKFMEVRGWSVGW